MLYGYSTFGIDEQIVSAHLRALRMKLLLMSRFQCLHFLAAAPVQRDVQTASRWHSEKSRCFRKISYLSIEINCNFF